MALFRNNAFETDDWRALGEDETPPFDGKVILTLADWRRRSENSQLRAANIPLGLRLEPGDKLDAIAHDLAHLALIAIRFPAFTDGRGYSMAHQIRVTWGFAGELRATGDILFDQLHLLSRCGFDAFEVSDAATIRLLNAGQRPDFRLYYQPGLGAETTEATRSWARRPLT